MDGIFAIPNPLTRNSSLFFENHPKSDPDCALGVHTASNQHNEHNEHNYEFYWGYKNHVLVDCISGLPLYELTTPANTADSTFVQEILAAANIVLPLRECTFLGDKGYDVKDVYNLVKNVYDGEAVIPLNRRNTKNSDKLPSVHSICDAGLVMHKDRRIFDNGRGCQKFCCPFRQSKTGCCPCNHKNWNNDRKNGAASSTKPFPPTTIFPLKGNAINSSRLTLCVPNVSGTIPALRLLVRSGFGFVMAPALPI